MIKSIRNAIELLLNTKYNDNENEAKIEIGFFMVLKLFADLMNERT